MVKSYNEDVKKYGALEPYTKEEIEEMKNTDIMIPIRFKRLLATVEQLEKAKEPRTIEEWDEDYGDCLWWSFPIVEPPYCGTPLDSDFPDYVTHFTGLILPTESKD